MQRAQVWLFFFSGWCLACFALRFKQARPFLVLKLRKISPATRFGRAAKPLPPSPAGWTHQWLLQLL